MILDTRPERVPFQICQKNRRTQLMLAYLFYMHAVHAEGPFKGS